MFPELDSTALILIDVQEKLQAAIKSLPDYLPRQQLALEAAKCLNLPVIVTEQYPAGLGGTVATLSGLFAPTWPVFSKTSFSCFGSTEFRAELNKKKIRTLALIGVETHVCVLQTALDAVAAGYGLWILEDAVTSRKASDRDSALAFLRSRACGLIGVEAFLFMLMRDATHPAFRAVAKLVK